MYGCRRGPNRKLNHTNLICGWGNQITCFGCSADDEFIFVTKLSRQRKRGRRRLSVYVCVCMYCIGWWWKEVAEEFVVTAVVCSIVLEARFSDAFTVSIKREDASHEFHNTNSKTATNVGSFQMLGVPCGALWRAHLEVCEFTVCVQFCCSWAPHLCLKQLEPKLHIAAEVNMWCFPKAEIHWKS